MSVLCGIIQWRVLKSFFFIKSNQILKGPHQMNVQPTSDCHSFGDKFTSLALSPLTLNHFSDRLETPVLVNCGYNRQLCLQMARETLKN